MKNDLITKNVQFQETELLAIQEVKTGKIYAGINLILRDLGFDERQIEYRRNKWIADKVLGKGIQKFSYPSKDGGSQETYCIEIKKLPLALAKIEITPKIEKNMPDLSEKLEKYQEQCADVLAQAFLPTYKSKETESNTQVPFKEVVQTLPVFADFLKVNDVSKLIMAEKLCESYNIPTSFLPDYVKGGDREAKSAKELLKLIGSNISSIKFNQILLENGYLEQRKRTSKSSKSGFKFYKALTEKGLKYGENLINSNNPKETQPYYYVDTFEQLYNSLSI